jgi:hypothetical protein
MSSCHVVWGEPDVSEEPVARDDIGDMFLRNFGLSLNYSSYKQRTALFVVTMTRTSSPAEFSLLVVCKLLIFTHFSNI